MKKYDKDVIARRFRERRRARESDLGRGTEKGINVYLTIFALGAVIVLAVVLFGLLR